MGEVKGEGLLGSPAHLPGITGISQAGRGEDTRFPESTRAPGPKPIYRFQVPGCSERKGLLFQEIPMASLDAQPPGPRAIGSAGRACTGWASGGIWCPGTLPRMGLGWDSDGTGDSTVGVLLPGWGVLSPSLLPGGPRDF